MPFLRTVPESEAEGELANQYQKAQTKLGYIPNYIKAFSLRPEVYSAWSALIAAIRSRMRLRTYELVTFAAAMAMDCSY